MVWTYCSQIANLHPECIVWKLFQALGSDHKPLIQEAANEVNNEKAERTGEKELQDSLGNYLVMLVQLGLSSTHMMSRMEPVPSRD